MGVCAAKAPRYVEAEAGHFVACHLYDTEIMDHGDEYDLTPYTPPVESEEGEKTDE